ncbi:hypothetical protein AB0H94_37445 [Streptomyces purpurascens]|uniref:hypothetical protein n=1 Tax=Streptomyces purpurascens TaxID=1924 RepID=UPI0033C6E47A
MKQPTDSRVPPPWARPDNRWGPWVYWPMLCLSVGLLVWQVINGNGSGRILVAAGLILVWVCLLAANRAARRRRE